MKKAKALLMALMVLPGGGPSTRVIDKEHDDPAKITHNDQIEMNLKQIDAKSRRSVSLVSSPWSDVTWKANKGLLAERFNDPNFEKKGDWREKSKYLNRYSASWVLSLEPEKRERWIAALSPAEKYDLLMGIVDNGLAKNIREFLDEIIQDKPAFPQWWGLCEGSAPSTMYFPEPVRPVILRSETYGVDIPFYAPDVKGLATMLWSRFNKRVDLPEAGLQCKKNGNGCFDSNPASFHAAVHHFLDLSPGILVGEMDPSPVVWNFPLLAYNEYYFRPDLGLKKKSRELRPSILRASEWEADPRRSDRAPGTAYIVGVAMRISYGVNRPQLPPMEGSLKRQVNSRDLVYELELDEKLNLLGGEWVAGDHPDLLWSVPKGFMPDTVGDLMLPPGGDLGDIPLSWEAAARVSAAELVPLRRVVELLVLRSSKP